MTPEKIYEKFLDIFPGMESQVLKYYQMRPSKAKDMNFPKDSIRILTKAKRSLIFGVRDDGSWLMQ